MAEALELQEHKAGSVREGRSRQQQPFWLGGKGTHCSFQGWLFCGTNMVEAACSPKGSTNFLPAFLLCPFPLLVRPQVDSSAQKPS